MSPYCVDHRIQLRLARERAAALRIDWRTANGPGRDRTARAVKPCGGGIAKLIGRLARRLDAMGPRPVNVTGDPCR
jgi:hypothetical protein